MPIRVPRARSLRTSAASLAISILAGGLLAGCGNSTDPDSAIAAVNQQNIQRLANLYFDYQMKHDWHGPPDEQGLVEIGYGIVPKFEGRGFATEAAEALIAFALADERVRTIQAHTLPVANASTRILTKCGFRHIGEVVSPDDGLVWRWELIREPS